MNVTTKIIGAIAVAGIVAAGSSAFTASGLVNTGADTQVVGGSVTQTVEGAELVSVAYHETTGTANTFDMITLTFSGGDNDVTGRSVKAVASGTFNGTSDALVCTAVGAGVVPTVNVSECTPNNTGLLTSVSSLTVTVNQ